MSETPGHGHRARTPSFAGASLLAPGESGSFSTSRPASAFGIAAGADGSNRASTSLSVNYVPSKFSDALATGGARRRRKGALGAGGKRAAMGARGGGVDAFKKGEARMPGPEDRDDLHPPTDRPNWLDKAEPGGRWTRFKWVLFVFNAAYSVFALVSLVGCLLLWLDIVVHADVIRVANRTELIFTTLAAAAAVFTSVFGWAGVMLNNRSFLALYTFFCGVIAFALLLIPGYLTYRHQSLNLPAKLNFQWSESLPIPSRRRVQNALGCCGYFSPFVEAAISSTCYARSSLPGCKAPLYAFERRVLRRWYIVVFGLAGWNICTIVAALLCSDHVTYRFGKGMMPERYRLDEGSVAVIMDGYAMQLADQYGPEVAAAALAQSQSRSQSRIQSTADLGTYSSSGAAGLQGLGTYSSSGALQGLQAMPYSSIFTPGAGGGGGAGANAGGGASGGGGGYEDPFARGGTRYGVVGETVAETVN
ncbi:hypothetical protein B0H11DRAFT_1702280 [Mycena galericulata]|nr:hypothetical protein B0H11DRAFT_1702280 [Mycena galericulata]